eukprot:COSAG01_NODE_9046_length_2571_cov_1.675162_2_plen_195_part_00
MGREPIYLSGWEASAHGPCHLAISGHGSSPLLFALLSAISWPAPRHHYWQPVAPAAAPASQQPSLPAALHCCCWPSPKFPPCSWSEPEMGDKASPEITSPKIALCAAAVGDSGLALEIQLSPSPASQMPAGEPRLGWPGGCPAAPPIAHPQHVAPPHPAVLAHVSRGASRFSCARPAQGGAHVGKAVPCGLGGP